MNLKKLIKKITGKFEEVRQENSHLDWKKCYENDTDQYGIISFFFNEKIADNIKGENSRDYNPLRGAKKPKNSMDKQEKYQIYQWGYSNEDYVEEGKPLLLIREIGYDWEINFKILPPVYAEASGFIEILIDENEPIKDGQLICKIWPNKISDNSNDPDSSIYFRRFNKFEIPSEILINDHEGSVLFGLETSDNTYLVEWLVKSGDHIKKGQEVCTLKGYHYRSNSISFSFNLKAKGDGIIDLRKKEQESFFSYGNLSQRELLYILFKDEESLYKYKYSNQSIVTLDQFEGGKTIKWKVVGGHLFPFGATKPNPIGGIISTSKSGKSLIFSFESYSGRDYISFYYFSDDFRLSKGDKVNFLFENGVQAEFEIVEKSAKADLGWKKLYVTKSVISIPELEYFQSLRMIRWKISLIRQNRSIEGVGDNDYYKGEFFSKVVNSLANEYIKTVEQELEEHQPLKDYNQEPDDFNIRVNGECYVYLMIDTTNNFYKIGISNSPQYREKTLQSEKPTIELICAKKFPTRIIAESIEKALHNSFKEKRIRGEWFELNEKDVADIIETLE